MPKVLLSNMKHAISDIDLFQNTLLKRQKKAGFVAIGKIVFVLFQYAFRLLDRLIEISLSMVFIVLFSFPVFVVLGLRRIAKNKDVFTSNDIYGKGAKKIKVKYFNVERDCLRDLSLFFYVLLGRLSLSGVSIKKYSNEERVFGDAYLFNNKPGIFNLWYIRQSSKIGHEGKYGIEWEYVFKKRLLSDLLLILKSIPAAFLHQSQCDHNDKVNLFGLEFDNAKMVDAVDTIKKSIISKVKKAVFFVNPDCLNRIFKDTEYFEVLKSGDYIYPDGIGINIACKIIKNPLKENVNGTDMLPFLCRMCGEYDYGVYLLGGKPGVADEMASKLKAQYNNLRIVGYRDGFFDHETESQRVVYEINAAKPDILLVAFGAPMQEKWISKHKDAVDCKVFMGVGGLFDFYSGNIRRAPKWMREVGLEWVYRLLQEPGRMWKRYIIGNPLFIFRVLKWKTYS